LVPSARKWIAISGFVVEAHPAIQPPRLDDCDHDSRRRAGNYHGIESSVVLEVNRGSAGEPGRGWPLVNPGFCTDLK
jgi:hypothetical protein